MDVDYGIGSRELTPLTDSWGAKRDSNPRVTEPSLDRETRFPNPGRRTQQPKLRVTDIRSRSFERPVWKKRLPPGRSNGGSLMTEDSQ